MMYKRQNLTSICCKNAICQYAAQVRTNHRSYNANRLQAMVACGELYYDREDHHQTLAILKLTMTYLGSLEIGLLAEEED